MKTLIVAIIVFKNPLPQDLLQFPLKLVLWYSKFSLKLTSTYYSDSWPFLKTCFLFPFSRRGFPPPFQYTEIEEANKYSKKGREVEWMSSLRVLNIFKLFPPFSKRQLLWNECHQTFPLHILPSCPHLLTFSLSYSSFSDDFWFPVYCLPNHKWYFHHT